MNLNSTLPTNMILGVQALITLIIALRAFQIYGKTGSNNLFSIGLGMSIIAIGGISGLIENLYLKGGNFNTFWFRYLGQCVSFFFILLCSLRASEQFLLNVKRWHIVASALLILLLILTPFFSSPPSGSPAETILSFVRSIICFIIFFNYLSIFVGKETRFSFLMSASFMIMAFGLAIFSLKFIMPDRLLFDYIGSSVRIVGLLILLGAFFAG